MSSDSLGHLAGALKKQWKRYRKELRRCQERFSEKAIHDSRVETRRLLATVELLCGFLPAGRVRKAERALKSHLDSFDDLRDTQVQLKLVGKMRRRHPAARKFHAFLLKREDRFAAKTRRRIEDIKTGRLGKWIGEFQERVEKQRKACAPAQAGAILLRTLNRKFNHTSRLRAQLDPRDARTIHCTRVAFKQFRYMVEALAACLPFANERRLEAMRHYQTLMGDVQDAEVLLAGVDKYLCEHDIESKSALRFRKELLDRRRKLIRNYLNAADRLLEFWPPR